MPAAVHTNTNASFEDEVEWFLPAGEKLYMDLPLGLRPCRYMDPDADNLVAQLCNRAGMTMEDAAHRALTLRSVVRPDRSEALSRLRMAPQQISVLLDAALVLDETSSQAGDEH